MSFTIRRNVKSYSDINHNFHVLDWLMRGNIDSDNINSVSVDKISGSIVADEVTIGASTTFEEGYDYTGKLTYLSESGIYTGVIYADQIHLGNIEHEDGMTVIRGGYLNADVIEANSIIAEKLNVNDLSAISGNFTDLTCGSDSDYVTLYESAGKPYVTFVDSDVIRMGLTSDRLQLFTSEGNYGGTLIGEEEDTYGLPAITMVSPFMSRLLSVDSVHSFDRSSGIASRVHSNDLEIKPDVQMFAIDSHEAYEVIELTITNGCTSNGNVTLTLDEVDYVISLTTTEDTAEKVATAIYDHMIAVVDIETLWTIERDGAVVTFTAVTAENKEEPAYVDTDTTGATGSIESTTLGYVVNTACAVTLDEDVNILCTHGTIQLDGYTEIAGIDATDPTKRYKFTKDGAGGTGIINFTCEA